jgi:hypothetical protein
MAAAMSSVSCFSGAKLFSAAAAPQAATRRSNVQRISAVADKVSPDPAVVPPNVLECKLLKIQTLCTLYALCCLDMSFPLSVWRSFLIGVNCIISL